MSSTKFIVFNGPAGSGKDTFAEMFDKYWADEMWIPGKTEYMTRLVSFKEHLIDITLAKFGINEDEWKARYDNRELKETAWDKLGGKSQREALIEVSEDDMKPLYGKDYFGKAVVSQLEKSPDEDGDVSLYLCTDGGFEEELAPVVEALGSQNVLVIRLHRPGYDFTGDSRGLIKDEWFPEVKMIDVDSLELEETSERINARIEEWLQN